MPRNAFKRALSRGVVQYGIWTGLANPISAEICAGAGFHWLLIDAEHAPNDLPGTLAQLQAAAPYDTSVLVRPRSDDPALLKQYLDLGVQTLLVPMIDNAEQAERLVAATRYPPRGIRGVGTALARASRWNRVQGYFQHADAEICVIAQVETVSALRELPAIAAVDGLDAVFIGPADLAASLGHLGEPGHPQVRAAINAALQQIQAAGKPAGVMAVQQDLADAYIAQGATFVGVGSDTVLLAQASEALAARFLAAPPA